MLPFALATAAWVCAVAAGARGGDRHGTRACDALSQALPEDVVWPNSTTYALRNAYYSSRQAELHPRCFVTPRDTAAVSTVVRTLISHNEPFTVRCGGHTSFQGSSIGDGVTVDLVHLNDVAVAPDNTSVSIGAGNRWYNVSRALDPLGLHVVGGRVSDVGVGGLILGGGISYFSGTYGWACDNVRNFEVVLSSGQVVNASATANPDLYWALRGGGGSNFGIVTRFDLAAFPFPQGKVWHNAQIFPGAQNQTLLEQFMQLGQRGFVEDPNAQIWFQIGSGRSLGMNQSVDSSGVSLSLFHAAPPSGDTTPPVFQPIKSVPGAVHDSTTVANISATSLVYSDYSSIGSRKTSWSISVAASSTTLIQGIIALYEESWLSLAGVRRGEITPFAIFQHISRRTIEQMQKNGGNALGLRPDHGPFILLQFYVGWDDGTIDQFVEQRSEAFMQGIEKLAKSRSGTEKTDLSREFVYMNYAGKGQRVLQRYGADNYARLRRTARKWDPEQHLQRLWKGYFQLQDAAAGQATEAVEGGLEHSRDEL